MNSLLACAPRATWAVGRGACTAVAFEALAGMRSLPQQACGSACSIVLH